MILALHMGVIEWIVLTELQLSCNELHHIYNDLQHVTCSLAITTYKYNELQVSSAIQKLSCKAGCKTLIFPIMCPYNQNKF
jgi:hypothetical protein